MLSETVSNLTIRILKFSVLFEYIYLYTEMFFSGNNEGGLDSLVILVVNIW